MFVFVAAAAVGGIGMPAVLKAADLPAAIAAFFTAITIAQIVAAAGFVVLLMTGPAVDYFGIERRKRWAPLVVAVAFSAGLYFGVSWMIDRLAAGPEDDAINRLTLMGERRANSEEDITFMLGRLDDGSMEERLTAAWALGRSGRGDVIEALLDTSRDDRDVSVKINAIGAVAALGGAEIEADLVGFLEDDEQEVQAAALRGLADEKFDGSVEVVGQFMAENEALRSTAVDALGNMGSTAALPFLRRATADEEEDVRTRAGYWLGKLGDKSSVPTLIGMLDDPSWSVRANAAQSLGMLGDPAARAALEGLGDDPSDQVRGAAESALLRLP